MKWEIMILTQPSRKRFLEQLLDSLIPQCFAFDVSVNIKQFDRGQSLGRNRELMRLESKAEYISFLDDDDLIAPHYVSRIFPLLDGVDYIGYDVQTFANEKTGPIARHSLTCGGWDMQPGWHRRPNQILKRDIVHFNPLRRELALAVPMEGGRGEDERWARALGALGIVKTEHFISEIMQYYLWRKPKLDATDSSMPFRLRMIEKLRASTCESTT